MCSPWCFGSVNSSSDELPVFLWFSVLVWFSMLQSDFSGKILPPSYLSWVLQRQAVYDTPSTPDQSFYYPVTEWPRIPGKMSRKLAAKTKKTRMTMSSGTLRPAACRG